MTDILIQGRVTALAPINISHKDQPVPGVPMIKRVQGGSVEEVPCLPGNTFRGLLRSRAARLTVDAYAGLQSLDGYYLLFKGGIKGSEKEASLTFDEHMEYRRQHPVLGLFGSAAPHWLAGRLSVSTAMPEGEAGLTEVNGTRRDEFRLDPSRLASLPEAEREAYARYVVAMRGMSALKREEDEALAEYRKARKASEASPDDSTLRAALKAAGARIEEVKAKAEEYKASVEGFSATVGRPLDPVNAIAPGSAFSQRMVADGVTDEEAGLLVETLRSLAGECRIGGKRSIGFGDFEAEWTVSVRDGGFGDWEHAATLRVAPELCEYVPSHPFLERAAQAWKTFVDERSAREAA